MNIFKTLKENTDQKWEIINLKEKIAELEAKIKLNEDFDNWTSVCSVDFEKMNVVSIERIYDYERNIPKTVMGYIQPEGKKVSEWQLFITPDEHLNLINLFETYKASK